MTGSNHCQCCGHGWCDECIAERQQLRNEVCQLRIKLVTKQEEIERLHAELAAEQAIWCDQPEDRMYHAEDGTWWKRAENGQCKRADPPEEIERLQAADTLRTIQTELKPWQERNFPDRPVWMPVMGLAEEAGEACHALLKREQNIRCDEDHTSNLHDALADIIVFACDVANAEGIDLARIVASVWAKVKHRDWVSHRKAAEAAGGE